MSQKMHNTFTRTRLAASRRLRSLALALALIPAGAMAQSYTSYFTGDTTDAVASPTGGVCLMGGASEDDNAMRWFLDRSGGGDILVLRASGSNGYNAYLYSQLGATVNSVETIRFDAPGAASDPYVQRRVREAEAIWFAGGDQFDYITYWRGNAIDSLINDGLHNRQIVIGGTSAGMAILGQYYFSAANGTVTSATAMGNPYAAAVTPDSTAFLDVDFLDSVITDTHYDNPDRRGRQMAFLARIFTDYGVHGRGIACDEYTAVCIGTDGIGHVYGDYPNSDDNAYFLQVNCEVPGNMPEVCQPGLPLQWDQSGNAVKVYNLKGTPTGANTFDLNDWKTGVGGTWETWSVYSSSLFTAASTEISCGPVQVAAPHSPDLMHIYPNPSTDGHIQIQLAQAPSGKLAIRNALGQVVWEHAGAWVGNAGAIQVEVDLGHLSKGIYWLQTQIDGLPVVRALILE
jgi:cyanophycinase-like exopeptidase